MRTGFSITIMLLVSWSIVATAEDWVVAGTEVVEDQVIELDGELRIESGGSLTLRNVQLTFENASNGEHGVRVKNAGSLTLENGTVITTSSDVWAEFTCE